MEGAGYSHARPRPGRSHGLGLPGRRPGTQRRRRRGNEGTVFFCGRRGEGSQQVLRDALNPGSRVTGSCASSPGPGKECREDSSGVERETEATRAGFPAAFLRKHQPTTYVAWG